MSVLLGRPSRNLNPNRNPLVAGCRPNIRQSPRERDQMRCCGSSPPASRRYPPVSLSPGLPGQASSWPQAHPDTSHIPMPSRGQCQRNGIDPGRCIYRFPPQYSREQMSKPCPTGRRPPDSLDVFPRVHPPTPQNGSHPDRRSTSHGGLGVVSGQTDKQEKWPARANDQIVVEHGTCGIGGRETIYNRAFLNPTGLFVRLS